MKHLKKFPFINGLISFFVFWEILHVFVQSSAIPTPVDSLVYIQQNIELLGMHVGASLLRIFFALLFSLVIGIPLGFWLGRESFIAKLLLPFIYFLYPLPKMAFLPVFMLLFGLGNISKICLLLSITTLQIAISLRDGVKSIPKDYFHLMTSFHANKQQILAKLIWPACLPHLFSSLRISIGISLATLFFAENYATEYGIGYLIMSSWSKLAYDEMFAGILLIGILGYILFQLIDRLERHFLPYQYK